jgi:hypothetical protein
LIRGLARALLLVALLAAAASGSDLDLDFHDCASARRLGEGECQHFLRNPAGPTDDPCWCDKCRNGGAGERHDGKTVPPGWSATLLASSGVEAYLKRHCVAWGLTCSECLANDKPWPDATTEKPLGTVPTTDYGGQPARKSIDARLAAERRLFKKPENVVLVYGRHFYVVTDVDPLKVRTQSGGERLVSRHEWAHLMLERAEFARREWVRNFGEPTTRKPCALFFPERERDLLRIGQEYFRIPGAKGLRGGGGELCDGMCLTAVAFSREKQGTDVDIQVGLRHQLSRALLSIYAALPTRPKSLPVWLDEGLAHWLVRTRFPDEAEYTAAEAQGAGQGGGAGRGWSGRDWDKDLQKYVQTPGKLPPIEEMLAKVDVAQLAEEDHKRAWSIADLCLAEWREPFVKLVRALRNEKDLREAFETSFHLTPEAFDERWRARVSGRAASMQSGEAPPAAAVGERDRRSLSGETSPPTLAAKLRGLGEIKDAKTIPLVVDLLAAPGDLVRENAFVALLKTKEKDCLDALWRHGLDHVDGVVRAYAARLCGRLKVAAASPKLEAQLGDDNWLARAEAAVACGALRQVKALPALRRMADADPSEKARVGAIDALALFGEDAQSSLPLLTKSLDAAHWQIRVAAAHALGDIGRMDAVEPLIARMEIETGGRVADEIHGALKRIVRDDLGRRPSNWRKWWEREKEQSPNGLPARPPEKPKREGPVGGGITSDRDSPPAFGVEIYSGGVAFVLDATETMATLFRPSPAGTAALSREYLGRDKLSIGKEEIGHALSHMDPRAHFNVIAFGMRIRSFRPSPVPVTAGNVEEAKGFLASLVGEGRTNYYGALKSALAAGEAPDASPDFGPTPDTVVFLTDGLPNEGELIDADTLVEWYAGLNRYVRMKTHAIAFGVVGVDLPLLKGLAERSWGTFTLIPELKPDGR